MTAAPTRTFSRSFSLVPGVSALLLALALSACGTTLQPTVVEVAGRHVELVDVGEGSTSVVFESGFGNDWTNWDRVASELSAQTRVFAYSRPGYGKSDPTDAPRTATRIVEDLRALLAARGVPPPYVLVGHSFGGTYIELFAKQHPDEVAGVVLVDPRRPEFGARCEAAGISGCGIPASYVATMSADLQGEFNAFPDAAAELQATSGFGSYPVRVLTATAHGNSEAFEALWSSMLGALADEATDGEQLVFPGVGHNIQWDEPQKVAAIIRGLVTSHGR